MIVVNDKHETVALALSAEEALVLFEWLKRFNEREDNQFDDQAEERVLWDLESMLERRLEAPLEDDYAALLAAARSKVRDPAE